MRASSACEPPSTAPDRSWGAHVQKLKHRLSSHLALLNTYDGSSAAAAKRTRGHSAMVSPVPVALESTPRSRDRRPRTLIDGVETTSSRWSCSVEALAVAQDVQASDKGAHRRERWLNC